MRALYFFAIRLPTIVKTIPNIKIIIAAVSTITLKVLNGIISFFVIIRDTFGPNCNVMELLTIYKNKLKTKRTLPNWVLPISAHPPF